MNERQEIRQEREGQKVLTRVHEHQLHELARKSKGIYVQFMQLLKDLDIPFRQ